MEAHICTLKLQNIVLQECDGDGAGDDCGDCDGDGYGDGDGDTICTPQWCPVCILFSNYIDKFCSTKNGISCQLAL